MVADVGVVYTLTTPGPDITFNQYTDPFTGHDQYYITEIRGLEAPDLRTPIDPVPLGDGALIHDFYYGATHITFEVVILVQSTSIMDDIVEIRNDMTYNLKSALNSMLTADGSLAFNPQGSVAAQTINGLRYEVGLQTPHADNYLSLQFSFGLITGTPYS
jgi:hypothetical protein